MKLSMIQNLAIWGDSLLKGIIFDEKTSRYKPLKTCSVNLFSKAFPFTVKNNSRFGCTATKALENLQASLNNGLQAEVALLEFGGNDCDYNWSEISRNPEAHHEPHTPFQTFCSTMEKMADLLLSHSIKPVFMNLPPIDGERYYRWISSLKDTDPKAILKWLGGQTDTIYRQQERYSRAMELVAYQKNLPLIDVRDEFLAIHNYRDYLCLDGIHLNEQGQKVMADIFQSYAMNYA